MLFIKLPKQRGAISQGSPIEASKIAGHSDLEVTGEYTFVTAERQNELTRRIQEKLADAAGKRNDKSEAPAQPAPPRADLTSRQVLLKRSQ